VSLSSVFRLSSVVYSRVRVRVRVIVIVRVRVRPVVVVATAVFVGVRQLRQEAARDCCPGNDV